MKKIIITTALVIAALIAGPVASAQTQLSAPDGKKIAESVSKNYKTWQTVSLSGKLFSNLLPISPSVKIFMRRGEEITLSVSAIFVGEVGRVRLRGDSVFAVNKLNKTYTEGRIGDLFTDLPVNITDVQSLILARAFVAGQGELNAGNAKYCNFYADSGEWLAIPKEAVGGTINYGYSFDSSFRLSLASAVDDSGSLTAIAQYSYNGKKTQTDVSLTFMDKTYTATLTLDKPAYGASPFSDIRLDGRYRRVGIRDFVKSMSKF